MRAEEMLTVDRGIFTFMGKTPTLGGGFRQGGAGLKIPNPKAPRGRLLGSWFLFFGVGLPIDDGTGKDIKRRVARAGVRRRVGWEGLVGGSELLAGDSAGFHAFFEGAGLHLDR